MLCAGCYKSTTNKSILLGDHFSFIYNVVGSLWNTWRHGTWAGQTYVQQLLSGTNPGWPVYSFAGTFISHLVPRYQSRVTTNLHNKMTKIWLDFGKWCLTTDLNLSVVRVKAGAYRWSWTASVALWWATSPKKHGLHESYNIHRATNLPEWWEESLKE